MLYVNACTNDDVSRRFGKHWMRIFVFGEDVLDDEPLKYFIGAVPVAVELLPNSENLLAFEHPANAVYLFGPEDGSVPYSVRGLCHRRVFIPTRHCINLGAAIYVLLYDRLVKQYEGGTVASLPIGEVLAEPRGWPANNPLFERNSGQDA